MDFLKNLGETFNGAIDFVIEKNRKFSKVASLKKQIKKESNEVVKSYIVLGKHYYNELRDVPNYDMQKICKAIDNYKQEIKRLKDKLEEVKNEVDLSNFEEFVQDEDPIVNNDIDLEETEATDLNKDLKDSDDDDKN